MQDNSWEESRRIHLNCGHSYHHKRFRELLNRGICPSCNTPFDQRAIDHFNKIENPPPKAPQTFSPFIEHQENNNVYISPQTQALIERLNGKKPSSSWWPFQFGNRKFLKLINKEIIYLSKL